MNYLVDTHVFLWIIISPQKISSKVKIILRSPVLVKYVSIITFWEISLKYQLEKIDLKGAYPTDLPNIAKKTGFELLGLEFDQATSFYKLPKLKNKDPFDRMLAWQAINKNYVLLTKDPDFAAYKNHGLKMVW